MMSKTNRTNHGKHVIKSLKFYSENIANFSIFKDMTMGSLIQKEMKKKNLHYSEVRGDVLLPPHGTSTSCSKVK